MSGIDLGVLDDLLARRGRDQLSEAEFINEIHALPVLGVEIAELALARLFGLNEQSSRSSGPFAGERLTYSLDTRRNAYLLVYESLKQGNAGTDAYFRALHGFLVSTIDLLSERHDSSVQQRALDSIAADPSFPSDDWRALILQGRLFLEPYAANQYQTHLSAVDARDLRQIWLLGFPHHYRDLDNTPFVQKLPDIGESLDRAQSFFEKAADIAAGTGRGQSLAHLALVQLTGARIGRPYDGDAVTRLIREAQSLTPTRDDPTVWARLFDFSGDLADPLTMFQRTPIHVRNPYLMVFQFGMFATAELYLTAMAMAVVANDKKQAVEYADLLLPHLPRKGMEPVKIAFDILSSHCLPGDSSSCAQHEAGSSPTAFLQYGQVGAAVHSISHRPGVLEDYLKIESAISGANEQPLKSALNLLLAVKELDVNHQNSSRSSQSMHQALCAASRYLPNYPEAAAMCIRLFAIEASKKSPMERPQLIALLDISSGMATKVSTFLPDIIQQLWQTAMFSVAVGALDDNRNDLEDALIIIQQLMKGRSFAAAVSASGTHAAYQRLIRDAHELRSSATGLAELAELSYWSIDGSIPLVLEAPLTRLELSAGQAENTQTANGRRIYHNFIAGRLKLAVAEVKYQPKNIKSIQEMLPSDAAILSFVTGDLGQRRGMGILTQLIAKSFSRVILVAFSEPNGIIGQILGTHASLQGEGLLHLPGMFNVAGLLDELQEDPHGRDMTRDAEGLLADTARGFAPVFKILNKSHLLDDIEHLYIWPYQQCHSLPFWLLPLGGSMLAQQFVTAYLPSVEALSWKGSPIYRREIFVIAAAEGGIEYGLPYEKEIEDSANGIAAIFGQEAVAGNHATPEEFLANAGSARYVHIAAHGARNSTLRCFIVYFLMARTGGFLPIKFFNVIYRLYAWLPWRHASRSRCALTMKMT